MYFLYNGEHACRYIRKFVLITPKSDTNGIVRSHYLFYLLTVGVEFVCLHLITFRHTLQSVGLLWARDRPVAETST
jgi:hypothetical protein